MNQNAQNLLYAICFVVFSAIMAALAWFLKYMGLEFIMGALFGITLMLGCFGIISREFRNLH